MNEHDKVLEDLKNVRTGEDPACNGGIIISLSRCCNAPTYWAKGGIRAEKCSMCDNYVPKEPKFK